MIIIMIEFSGSTPYPGMSADEVMKKIKGGYRLEKPTYCRREVFEKGAVH